LKKKDQVVEYTIRMDKAHSDELVKMAEADGEDNELVYLENMVVSVIEEKEFFRIIK
jgi:hypothetical protein